MSLPSSYSGAPGEEPHHYFRNVCISFKKTLNSSKNIIELQTEMDRFINAAKQMHWHQKNEEIWRKDEGEKAANKVFDEFRRYVKDLESSPEKAVVQDLLDAISNIERLIGNLKIDSFYPLLTKKSY